MTVDQEHAERIAAGQDHFPPVRPDPVVQINRILVFGFAGMAVITVFAIASLLVFSVYRGQERRSFNQVVATLEAELDAARQQRSDLQRQVSDVNLGVECRAGSQLAVDRATAGVLVVIGQQFASAIDQQPPPPDAAAVASAAAALDVALDERETALARCVQD